MTIKLCINCINCEANEYNYFCHAEEYKDRINLVTGKEVSILCETMRRMELLGCGQDAKWFRPADRD